MSLLGILLVLICAVIDSYYIIVNPPLTLARLALLGFTMIVGTVTFSFMLVTHDDRRRAASTAGQPPTAGKTKFSS